MTQLGTFHRIRDIRGTWPNEATDFTPWLASQLPLLSESLGMGREGLELEATEVPVGKYRADIVCRDLNQAGDATVLIENQYGHSDHDHFGKLLTYASGLKAATVVLICENLREEHRTALTWLNTITADDHRFFAVELELWRIDNSPIAPRFNVVVEPDDWARMAEGSSKASERGELSDLKRLYLQYWGAFREFIRDKEEAHESTLLRPRKPLPQMWTGFAVGRSGIDLNAVISSQNKNLKVELTLNGPNSHDWREELLKFQPEIEAEIGYGLDWTELGGTQQAIRVFKHGEDPTDQSRWPEQHEWLYDRLRDLYLAFHDRVKAL
ncbi:DUF4268 domain-containing protein [Vannielia litorea]|uniref:DUF4268 domain-containing protein n=1 Tax=Vannielia litorea TaxID=1217970 RepID=UPI001BCB0835|nr:DUF4268 domain-containing protein [Vannielia litorea]MBS8228387.1 DUF4268 domain-containing protein [Vannielia litorea]